MQDRVARFVALCERESETMEEFAERVAGGETLQEICSQWDVPTARFAAWVAMEPRRREVYEAALQIYGDLKAAETLEIADTGGGNVQHARLRVMARQWVASKWFRERYGDALQVEHTGETVVRLSFGASRAAPALVGQSSTVLAEGEDI